MSRSDKLYEQLDPLYREIWGEGLHHGLWYHPSEDVDEAKANLVNRCLEALPGGESIIDVGCGYGSVSRQLARNYKVVHAITNSSVQYAQARAQSLPEIQTHLKHWFDFKLQDKVEAIIALESLSHFASFQTFASRCHAHLQVGGTLVVADWFGQPQTNLARVGGIPPWRTTEEWIKTAEQNGFALIASQDLTTKVARTWREMFRRSVLLSLRKPHLLIRLLVTSIRRPSLVFVFPRLSLAYASGKLNYSLLTLKKIE